MFIRAMVRIFSFVERWNVPFNSAVASLNETFHLSPHENILTTNKHSSFVYTNRLEVTIARKVLPHPQGIKGSMQNLLNKGLFI
jgi:hypothetical protein